MVRLNLKMQRDVSIRISLEQVVQKELVEFSQIMYLFFGQLGALKILKMSKD